MPYPLSQRLNATMHKDRSVPAKTHVESPHASRRVVWDKERAMHASRHRRAGVGRTKTEIVIGPLLSGVMMEVSTLTWVTKSKAVYAHVDGYVARWG
jgi:hypothetical protein